MTTAVPAHTFGEPLTTRDELLLRVTEQLQRRLGGRLRKFELTIHEGGLILQGQSPTYYGKQMAQEIAMQLSGLEVSANRIEVY